MTLDSVRYFDLFVPTEAIDENNKPVSISIGSRIEHTSGVLLVDATDNKSGANDIDIFPSFSMISLRCTYFRLPLTTFLETNRNNECISYFPFMICKDYKNLLESLHIALLH